MSSFTTIVVALRTLITIVEVDVVVLYITSPGKTFIEIKLAAASTSRFVTTDVFDDDLLIPEGEGTSIYSPPPVDVVSVDVVSVDVVSVDVVSVDVVRRHRDLGARNQACAVHNNLCISRRLLPILEQ
jgi:hypothetical protein